MSNHYHFITRWRVKGTAEEVYSILSQPLDYSRWWPSVYLTVSEVGPHSGAGTPRVRLQTKGWLPYVLRWEASSLEFSRPSRIAIRASGDLEGRGIWSIIENAPEDGSVFTDITFDWKLSVTKPWLRYLAPLLRPAFEANHRWAMAQGLKSLELELARSRAATVEEMNSIAPPDGPREMWTKALAAGAVMAAGLAAGLLAVQEGHEPSARPS